MRQLKEPEVPRRAIRKHPTAREATLMQWALYDIGHMSAEAKGLQETIYRAMAAPWDIADFPDSGIRFTFGEAIPTLLIMKLSAAVEDTLDVLWARRFPEVDKRRLRHEDKLSVMEKLHNIDLRGIRELWKLRNECAHNVKTMASWADFETHFESVYQFVGVFQKTAKPRQSPTAPEARLYRKR